MALQYTAGNLIKSYRLVMIKKIYEQLCKGLRKFIGNAPL